jgi:hypothetical protein
MKNYNDETFPDFSDIQNQFEGFVKSIEEKFKNGDTEQVGNLKTKKDISNFLKKISTEPNSKIERNKGKTIIKDYRGVYTFAEKTDIGYNYLYTGITRAATERINDHIHSGNTGSATWVYLKVKEKKLKEEIKKFQHRKESDLSVEEKKEKDALKVKIKKAIKEEQEGMHKLFVTFIPIENDNYLLHMIEPYIAAKLKCKWNSFKTH